MARLEYITQQRWFLGKVIGEDQFDPHQEDILRGLALSHLDKDGYGLISSSGSQAAASGTPDLYCNTSPAVYMVPDGKLIGWNASEQIDCSIADQGTSQGPTAAALVGTKRYVVVAGRHVWLDEDPDTDDDGNPVYFTRKSSCEFGVWMSADVALADVWYNSVTLRNLIAAIIADNQIPIALGIREYGATVLDQDHLFEIYRTSQVHEYRREHAKQTMAELVATGFACPMILNSAGTAAISGQAVSGQPGTVTLAGGELCAFALDGEAGAQNLYAADNHKRRVIVRPLPLNEVLTLLAANTTYIVRAKVDPQTLQISVYFGTGDYPNDEAAGWNPGNSGAGSQGGTNLGYLNTWRDMAIAIVQTGALGDVPTVTQIRNDHSARLAYVNQQAGLVGSKANSADVEPMVLEYQTKQPYFEGNILSFAKPLSAGVGLNLDIAAMKFRGGFHNDAPYPYGANVPADTIVLTDNAINQIYCSCNADPAAFAAANVSTGGGVTADKGKVVLGFVRTSGGSITQIVFSPMTRAETEIQDVICDEMYVNDARELFVGPTVARAIIGSGSDNGVFKSPWTSQIDYTLGANWDGGVVGGTGWVYVYADPGGSGGGISRNYCKFLLSTTRPDAESGRHPTKPNLVHVGACYMTGGAQLLSMHRKGDTVVIQPLAVVTGGAATSRTAIALSAHVPDTASHVRLHVSVNPLATAGPGSVDVSIYQEATGNAFAVLQASGDSGTNNAKVFLGGVVEVPIDRSVAGGRIHYAISNASATTNIYVVGWRESKTQADELNLIAY